MRVRIHQDVYPQDLRTAFAYYRELDSALPGRMAADYDERRDVIARHPLAGRALFGPIAASSYSTFPTSLRMVTSMTSFSS